MEKVLNKILAKLDKIELVVSAVKNDVKQLDNKINGITVVVAKTMRRYHLIEINSCKTGRRNTCY